MSSKYQKELIKILCNVDDPKVMNEFLGDILTPQEFEEIIKRWQIVKKLSKKIPQRKIASELKVSIAKITRGSRMLRNKKGGFWKILNKK